MTTGPSNDNRDPTEPLDVEGMRKEYIDAINLMFSSKDVQLQAAISAEMMLLDDPQHRVGLFLYMFNHIKRLSHENDEMRKAIMNHADTLREGIPAIAYTQQRVMALEEFLGVTYEEPGQSEEEGAQLQ